MGKRTAVALAILLLGALMSGTCRAYDMVKKDDPERPRSNNLTLDVNRDGSVDKITLIKKEPPRDFTGEGVVKDAFLRIEEGGRVISAPLNEPICYRSSSLENVVISDEIDPFIAVSSCVPNADDDWSVILYSFDGKSLVEQLKVTSNEPSIELKDTDNSGVKDIVVMDRDYANDPAVDKFITTYKYIDGKWQRASVYRTKTKEFVKSKYGNDL